MASLRRIFSTVDGFLTNLYPRRLSRLLHLPSLKTRRIFLREDTTVSGARHELRRESIAPRVKTSNAPRRCRIKDLLRRSHSDGAVSTTSEHKRCRFRDLLRRSHSDGGGSGGSSALPSGNSSPVARGKSKTTSNKSTTSTNTGEVNMRRKTYLPYRQDLIGVFAGISRPRR